MSSTPSDFRDLPNSRADVEDDAIVLISDGGSEVVKKIVRTFLTRVDLSMFENIDCAWK